MAKMNLPVDKLPALPGGNFLIRGLDKEDVINPGNCIEDW